MLQNNKLTYVIFWLFTLLFLLIIIYLKNYKFDTLWDNRFNFIRSDTSKIYSTFPNLVWKDIHKEQCFQFQWSHWFTIDCFIPADFEQHLQWVEDKSHYIKLLSNAVILEQVVNLQNEYKDPFLQFIDYITPDWVWVYTWFADMKTHLLQVYESKDYNLDDLLRLRYLYALESDFAKIQEIENKMKWLTWSIEFFNKHNVKLLISWTVKTPDNLPIPNASVKMLWTDNSTLTDNEWNFKFDITTLWMRTIRLEAFKLWFSNWVIPYQILVAANEQNLNADFVLEPYTQFAVIDTINKTIVWENTSFLWDDYIVNTNLSKYYIPSNAFIHEDGKQFKWKVNAYFFEFTKASNNQNLLENDIFDDVSWYAWNLMKTFWMPYALFVTDSWERIHVLESNSIRLEYKIPEMNALRTNQDKIYEPLTEEDMQFLLDKSNELSWYPIDRQFLIDNKLVRFPAFWIFDQTKWIWVNQWLKVLNTEWSIELLFYTKS